MSAADALNGHPSLTFDGASTCVEIADSPTLQWGTGDFALYMVGRYANSNANAFALDDVGLFWTKITNASPFPGFQISGNVVQSGGSGLVDSSEISAAVVISTEQATSTTGLNDDRFRIIGAVRTGGTNLVLRIAGAVAGSATVDAIDISQPGQPVFIGGQPSTQAGQASSEFLQGDIAEVVAVKGTLTTSNMNQLESYFALKYGL